MTRYDPDRRLPRGHRRTVKPGTERFDVDGVKVEPEAQQAQMRRMADDDARILGELPPHWGVFQERI